MGTGQIHRWESGALAHGVTDPFGQGPLPWLRGADLYFDDTGLKVPWYVDLTEGQGNQGRVPNARTAPGTEQLRSGLDRPSTADDVTGQIKGFAAASGVLPGGALDLRVSVNPPQEFTVDVYRIGHYGGAGARHMAASPQVSGLRQPAPMVAGRTVSCHHWWMSWRLQIPGHWPPGAYVAVLTTADNRYRSHIPFTVRSPARAADLMLLLPDVTWQAYNMFPEDGRNGASLYHAWDEKGRLLGESEAAITVSFDRPYAGAGLPLHVGHAYDVIRWAERYGYDLAYANATDLHAGRVDPSRHRGLIFPGHDEYWSEPMRRSVETARDAGTSLVFLSANTMYWKVELEPGPSGDPDRLISCRKRQRPIPLPPGSPRTSLWRDSGGSGSAAAGGAGAGGAGAGPGGETASASGAEQRLLGIQYAGRVPEPAPLVVRNADHWLWEGTGVREHEPLEGLVAGEADRYHPRAPLPESSERLLLAHSPYQDVRGATRHQETSLYRAPSGAWVFASGTFAWSPALDRPGHTDARVQRATANLLDRICKLA
ncbi:N,N-dimethylformamidase beta subunit family domain-containing protein [Phaeacidiphilus oryzae]|uniref:N,N-dimethylformamidase beta subunit family domain-containing protein n=1 Tax=Phaeacidiphilus oryzae TaxID=348818 RepID=UPI00056A9B16|nr:N,N-dimethylformamidase beta subunit family domain-containing protein [Phaeacidiphilus oryzae]